mmetsp:Transcript_27335/g.78720  ORF Transcript_27335/g.78720 Transcript_27335/m.78720 type:complete len:266 (-) Transcript_27335:97-894(-)
MATATVLREGDAETSTYSSSEESSSEECEKPQGPIHTLPPNIRSGFIQKVYSLLSVQLAMTLGIGLYMHLNIPQDWVASHIWVYFIIFIVLFSAFGILLGATCCCPQVLRGFPSNYIFLFTFTALMSVVVGFVCTVYTGPSVLMAVATTSIVFMCLTAYACCTKSDFTGMRPYLIAALNCLCTFSLVIWVWSFFAPLPRALRMVYAFVGVILFCFHIVYDTQLIVGGRHKKFQFGIDDYVLAAVTIYLDIINLFLNILQLLGSRN